MNGWMRWLASIFIIGALPGSCVVAGEGTRRVLIVCGHPGNLEYRQLYAETLDQIQTALTSSWQVSPEEIRMVWGTSSRPKNENRAAAADRVSEKSPPGAIAENASSSMKETLLAALEHPATCDDLRAAVQELQQKLKPEDALWVIIIGHASFDGRHAWLNMAGPDPNESELAKVLQELACRECVFWLTTSLSGHFVHPLAKPGRILISATDTTGEFESTLFSAAMAEVLLHPPAQKELDLDQNGTLSLLDLYLAICREVIQRYADQSLLLTEHAQLEDNGDGRGREVQQYYFPEELGGRLRPGAKPAPRLGQVDGARSAKIPLSLQRSTPKGDLP